MSASCGTRKALWKNLGQAGRSPIFIRSKDWGAFRPFLGFPFIRPTAIASASGCAFHGSRRSPQSFCSEPRRICHTENAALPHAPALVGDGELQRMVRDCFDRGLDCQGKTLPKFRANIVIPSPRVQQVLIRLRRPEDGECHGFLNRPAFTCCHGMTSEGFWSCRAMR